MDFVRKLLKSPQNSSDRPDVPDQLAAPAPEVAPSPSPDTNGRERRRSTRLLVAVPVTISGKNARGQPFREETHTISINRQGASLATWQTITLGSEILVENPPRGLAVEGKVVGFSEKSAPTMPHQIRVELLDPKNIWGIQYPPLDWRRPPAIATTKPVPSPVARTVPSVAAKPSQSEPVAHAASFPPRPTVLEVNLNAVAKTEAAPAKLESLSFQPEIDAERLFKAAGLKLAKLAGQIDARLQVNANQLLTRLDEKEKTLSSLTGQLTGMAERAERSHSGLEALLAEAEGARSKAQHEFQEAGLSLQQASEQLISSATQDLGKRLAEGLESTADALMEQMRRLAGEEITTAVKDFKEEMQKSLTGLAESRFSSDSDQMRTLHSHTVEETQTRIGALVGSAIERFEEQLERATESFRQATLPNLASECASKSALELEAKQSEALGRLQAEAGLITRSAVENLRAQIEQARAGFQETSLAGLSEQFIAQAVSELQAQQAGMVEQAQGAIQASTHSVLESSKAQLEQAARNLEETVLPGLAEKITAQATEHSKNQINQLTQAGLADFQGRIQQATTDASKSVLASFTRQSAAELEKQHAEAAEQFHAAISLAAHGEQEDFRTRIRHYIVEQQALAEQIAQKPSHEIARYAEDTLLMVREQLAEMGKESAEGIRNQLAAVTRGTLASIAEEARATAEEYRKQLREVFDGLRQKSATDVESILKEALERSRETALEQLQKDAEDFSSVAVAQFRTKSEEAARQAAEAVHKQVGAAAFVVKDWTDQATQRLDGRLTEIEAASGRALGAIETRSMDISKIVMQRVEQESEALVSDLRRRIQNAASALTQGFTGGRESKTAPMPEQAAEQEHSPDTGCAEHVGE